MTLPILQALLVADHVYQDRATGKVIVCGIFHKIRFKPADMPAEQTGEAEAGGGVPSANIEIPMDRVQRMGNPWVYVALTELRGESEFELRYVDLRENTAVLGAKFQLESDDPLATVELALPLPSIPPPNFDADERHRTFGLELLCDNELIGSHRILAVNLAFPE